MKKAEVDNTYQMVLDIYRMNVPSQSEIANPFSANKRAKKNSLLPKPVNELPEDVNTWTTRNFVDYFTDLYKKHFDGIYRKTYSSDCTIINEIMDFMDANDLEIKVWTKKYIDWCFLNKDNIIKKSGNFLLITLRAYLNIYFQNSIKNKAKSTNAIPIYEDFLNLAKEGKNMELFSVYGIPIASSYFINIKGLDEEEMTSGITLLIDKLLTGTPVEQAHLSRMVQRSINRSPYIDGFKLIDWRDKFPKLRDKYGNEPWWRDKDYTGDLQYVLDNFVNK